MPPERFSKCFSGALRCDLHPIIAFGLENVRVLMAQLLAVRWFCDVFVHDGFSCACDFDVTLHRIPRGSAKRNYKRHENKYIH